MCPQTADDFDAQWNRPRYSPLGGKRVRVYDIEPTERRSAVPVLISMGWLNGPRRVKGLMREIARGGRRVILVDARHGIDTAKIARLHHIHARKMAALVDFIAERRTQDDFSVADIVAVSEGCIVAVLAKHHHPELIRHLVLAAPAGMIGKDELLPLAVRFISDVLPAFFARAWQRGVLSEAQAAHVSEAVLTFVGAPHRALASVLAIAASDSRPMLEKLFRSGQDAGLAVIACRGDRAFPLSRIRQTLGEKFEDVAEIAAGTHNSPSDEAERFGILISARLAKLEGATPADGMGEAGERAAADHGEVQP